MKKLLIDADSLVYRAVYSVGESASPEEACDKFDSLVSFIFENTNEFACTSDDYTLYLTGAGNFRYDIAKTFPYKGNRPKEKPYLLEVVREYAKENYYTVVSKGEEADDLVAIEATRLGPDGCIVVSIDKDLMQVPGTLYNPGKNSWFKIEPFEGLKFFYKQLLSGDKTDNIHGIHGIGPVKAEKLLKDCVSEVDMFKVCLDQYNNDLPHLVENARLLWLRRKKGEMWEPPNTD